MILKQDEVPFIIVTDKDNVLMNAVQTVFPSSAHLWCQFHTNKNVKSKTKLTVKKQELWEEIGDVWDNIMYASTANQFGEDMMVLRTLYGDTSEFIQYINNNWLSLKHKFIKYLFDEHMHLGNSTTNR